MNANVKPYPVIPSLEKFWELLQQHGQTLLGELEPAYYTRFETCKKLGLSPKQTHKECDPLLSGKFNRLVDLLESLYEVRYYWKRLTEVARLLEVTPPVTTPSQISEAQWFIYNLDSYSHAEYGLLERIKKFLTQLERRLKLKQDAPERRIIREHINLLELPRSGARMVRDPLAHFQSQGVVGWRNDHQWEASLLADDEADFIEIYDTRMLHDKEFYLGYIRQWVPNFYETIDSIFQQLASFPIDKLR